MTSPPAFGRRAAPRASGSQPAAPQTADMLSPQAQAFRAAVSTSNDEPADFAAWSRSRRLSRIAAWTATFALMASGAVCFATHAPAVVSTALEIGGFGGGAWLRRARARRLAAIRAWEGGSP